MRHETRLVFMMISDFVIKTENLIETLYKIWDGRDDSEIEPELVDYKKKTLEGYN